MTTNGGPTAARPIPQDSIPSRTSSPVPRASVPLYNNKQQDDRDQRRDLSSATRMTAAQSTNHYTLRDDDFDFGDLDDIDDEVQVLFNSLLPLGPLEQFGCRLVVFY